jgi:hypothetical protein
MFLPRPQKNLAGRREEFQLISIQSTHSISYRFRYVRLRGKTVFDESQIFGSVWARIPRSFRIEAHT